MPLIQISLLQGRDPQTVSACVKAVARAASQALKAPLDTVRVIATEVPTTHWAVGDTTKAEQAEQQRKSR